MADVRMMRLQIEAAHESKPSKFRCYCCVRSDDALSCGSCISNDELEIFLKDSALAAEAVSRPPGSRWSALTRNVPPLATAWTMQRHH